MFFVAGFSPGCERPAAQTESGAQQSDPNEAIRVLAELNADVNEKENAWGAQVVLQGQQWGVNCRGAAGGSILPPFLFCTSTSQAKPPQGGEAFQSPRELSLGNAEDGNTAVIAAAMGGQVEVRAPHQGV